MAFCPYCGSEYDPDLLLCPICGKKISAALQKKVKAAPEGQWVKATVIPWKKTVAAAAAVVLIAALAAFGVWAFSGNGIFSNPQPTEPPGTQETKPTGSSTAESQATDAATDPSGSTTDPADQTTAPAESTTQPTTTAPAESTADPTNPTTDPTEPTTDPTDPTTKPTEPSTGPTGPSEDTTGPTTPTTDPTEPSTDPTKPSVDPTDPTPTQPKPSNSEIAGTWVGRANATEMFNQKLLEAYPAFGAYLLVDKFEVTIILSFTESGTMTYWANQGTFASQIGSYRSTWIAGITQYARDKYGVSPTAFKELTGRSVEETVDKVIASLQGKDVQSMTMSSVSYSYTGDRLILGNNMGQFTVKVTDTQLRMTSYTGVHQNAALEKIMVNTVFYK